MRRTICGKMALLLVMLAAAGCSSGKPRVVLYCAQDQEFAAESLAEFTRRTGIEVATKFDTEADKSVSLRVALEQEKNRPRCDVSWNNEILNTLRLQRQGMVLAYDSPSAQPFPASARAADHTWHAFANRARVLVVNTKFLGSRARPASLLDLADERWKGQVVMAKPQFGTSATQAACLFEVLGPEKAREFYLALRKNDVQIAPGNKQVAEWVGQGQAPGGRRVVVGVTDTDDALEEIQAGRPIAMIFPDRDAPKAGRMGTLFIPNTLAIIKGSPNPEGAKKLVDYLLSAEVEAKLAEAASHQIPLNPNVKARLPEGMETPQTVKAMDVDFGKAADLSPEVAAFLAKEFERP